MTYCSSLRIARVQPHISYFRQHLSSEVTAGKCLRKLALRLYARAPVHVPTLQRITVGDIKQAGEELEEAGDGMGPVHIIRVYDHKTCASFGPAEIPMLVDEMAYIKEVSVNVLLSRSR